VTDLVQAVWDDVETIVALLGRCFGGHGLAGCICQFSLTLQPEWRKNAKEMLRDGGLSGDTEQSARDIACLNGDPFNMIIEQLNSVIMSWIESGVNTFIVDPVNHNVHELNHVIEDVDGVLGGFVDAAESLNPANWFGRRLGDAAFDDIPIPDFEALKRLEAGRRLGVAPDALDNFSAHVYAETGYGRRLGSLSRAGVPLKMAASGARPEGARRRRKLGVQNSHVGMAPSGVLPYIPYVDDLCLNDPLKPNKPCMFGEEDIDWDACEDPNLAGGIDMLCCAPRPRVAPLRARPKLTSPCLRDRLPARRDHLHRLGRRDQIQGPVRAGLRGPAAGQHALPVGVRRQLRVPRADHLPARAAGRAVDLLGARPVRPQGHLRERLVRQLDEPRHGALQTLLTHLHTLG
jgi:hypothetical protein